MQLGSPRCFVVGFFDLMGIREGLKKLPPCEQVDQEGVDALWQIARNVWNFRDDFEKFKEADERSSQLLKEFSTATEHASRRSLSGNPVKFYTISDSVIAYSSIQVSETLVPFESCAKLLMQAAASQLFSLVRGIPVRGGIEIGLGAVLGEQEIFGQGLSEAYRLESKKADWPRILVGKQLRRYLATIAGGHCNSPSGPVNQAFADLCLKLIRIDSDDNAMLDLLSPELAEIIGDHYGELLAKARAFVTSELNRFEQEGNEKLARRYEMFSDYLNG